MCYDKFSKSYRFEMPSNYANSLSFMLASSIFNFFAYYTNGISVKLFTEDNGPFTLTKTLDLCQNNDQN